MTPLVLAVLLAGTPVPSPEGTIPAFPLEANPLELRRIARPGTPFAKVGRRFAVLGEEGGSFEAWAYPLKLFRSFEFSFLTRGSTTPVRAAEIVRFISVTPEATVLTYTFQSFTVKALFVTPPDEPGALCLLEIDATEPMTVVCGFLPVLQPMWPAGIGGQYARWDDATRAYLISESSKRNHAYVGSPAAAGISYTPAHMLSDHPNQFTIPVPDPHAVRGRYIPIIMAGGRGSRDSVKAVYARLAADPGGHYRRSVEHFRTLRRETMRLTLPDERLALAFEWAKVAYDGLLVDNPDLGRGMVAGLGMSGTSGRPGFGWFFGGDAFINALSMNGYGAYGAVRDALTFMLRWQREDGKMAHELTQATSYVDWFKDYPYAYIHGDTSPFFIVAAHDYVTRTGDLAFLRSAWPALRKAYEWCRSTDEDGDGLMDNARAGLGALEYGSLTNVRSDIYTGAVWVRAARLMAVLGAPAGDPAFVEPAAGYAGRAEESFRRKFWDARAGQYAYAFDDRGKHVDIVSPWSAVGLMWELGEPSRSALTLAKLNGAELTTDWGIRSLSNRNALYEPLNYNYGAVWPFLTGWVAAAQYRHGFPLQGYNLLTASAEHTFDNALGSVTEVFSGSQNIWPQEAVSHQGFCTGGVTLPLIRGMLGLEGNAIEKTLRFAPAFRADWDSVTLENIRIGECVLTLRYRRGAGSITLEGTAERGEGYTLAFEPTVGIGGGRPEVFLNGVRLGEAGITDEEEKAIRILRASFPAGPKFLLEFRGVEPDVEILPPAVERRTGEPDRGVKVISTRRAGGGTDLTLEGLAGKTYTVPIARAAGPLRVEGAAMEGDRLLVTMPAADKAGFTRRTVRLIRSGRDTR